MLWGDSRTEGIGDVAPFIFPVFVADALAGIEVIGAGRSSQTAAQIVARQGGEPARLTLAGNMIPASGAVDVTAASANLFFYAGKANKAGSYAGTLAGVAGVFACDGTARRSFTRSADGSAVAVAAGSPFLTDLGEASRDAVMFLCAGRNGIETEDPAETVRLTQAAVAHLSANPRYLIAGIMPDSDAKPGSAKRVPFDRLNVMLQAAHGGAYLDLSTPPSADELTRIGYVATDAEQADIAAGTYPGGMFADVLHLRRSGQMIWANRLVDQVRARGWA